MSEHSKEPWRLLEQPSKAGWGQPVIGGADPGSEVLGATEAVELSDADARRIVACVNACAGIPTEALEAGAPLRERVKRSTGRLRAAIAAYGIAADATVARHLSDLEGLR